MGIRTNAVLTALNMFLDDRMKRRDDRYQDKRKLDYIRNEILTKSKAEREADPLYHQFRDSTNRLGFERNEQARDLLPLQGNVDRSDLTLKLRQNQATDSLLDKKTAVANSLLDLDRMKAENDMNIMPLEYGKKRSDLNLGLRQNQATDSLLDKRTAVANSLLDLEQMRANQDLDILPLEYAGKKSDLNLGLKQNKVTDKTLDYTLQSLPMVQKLLEQERIIKGLNQNDVIHNWAFDHDRRLKEQEREILAGKYDLEMKKQKALEDYYKNNPDALLDLKSNNGIRLDHDLIDQYRKYMDLLRLYVNDQANNSDANHSENIAATKKMLEVMEPVVRAMLNGSLSKQSLNSPTVSDSLSLSPIPDNISELEKKAAKTGELIGRRLKEEEDAEKKKEKEKKEKAVKKAVNPVSHMDYSHMFIR